MTKRTDQLYEYGHKLTIKEIQDLMPFTGEAIKQDFIKNPKYTIAFNILAAYAYYLHGYEVIKWGCKYKGLTVFVFKNPRITIKDLPF